MNIGAKNKNLLEKKQETKYLLGNYDLTQQRAIHADSNIRLVSRPDSGNLEVFVLHSCWEMMVYG